MSDNRQVRRALTNRILAGPGDASLADRRAAFNNCGLAKPVDTLVDKVAKYACKVTDHRRPERGLEYSPSAEESSKAIQLSRV